MIYRIMSPGIIILDGVERYKVTFKVRTHVLMLEGGYIDAYRTRMLMLMLMPRDYVDRQWQSGIGPGLSARSRSGENKIRKTKKGNNVRKPKSPV